MFFRIFPTLTLVLSASSLAHAAITLVGGSPTIASDDAMTGHTTFSNVSVQAGDYVVVSTASNKSFSLNQLTYSWSGTEGVNGVSTSLSSQQTYAAYLSYTSIQTGGTYNFQVLASDSSLTANSALYVLRPGTGEMIVLAGNASQAEAAGTASTLSYLFGGSLAAGSAVAIEAATTQSGGAFTVDSNYLTPNSVAASNGRLISYSTAVNGGTWGSFHDFVAATDDIASVGAVFTTVSVPEPTRALSLAVGLGTLLFRRRKGM